MTKIIYQTIVMTTRPLLQVISTSPADSKIIQDSGADRIELVSALQIGGLTPSQAILRRSLEVAAIPTMVMVRHHNQGFVLSLEEKHLLIEQAVFLVQTGAKGLVIGSVTKSNKVDQELLQLLNQQINCNKIDITFHKASDYTVSLTQTYDVVKKYGIRRVLTQGGRTDIMQNQSTIKQLLKNEEVKTLLGGGINLNNIAEIVNVYRPKQVHVGTCVRADRFGVVESNLILDLMSKMSYPL